MPPASTSTTGSSTQRQTHSARWSRWGRDTTAAFVVSLAAVAFYLSTATLLFQGSLASHLPTAIGAALLGAAVLGVWGAAKGSLPLASFGPVPATVPVLAAITADIAAHATGQAALSTAVVALLLTGAAVGLAWWVMGKRRGGDVIRYIPYPVIGGFLGSVGWLMLTGGVGVSTGHPFTLGHAWSWLNGQPDLPLWAGLALGALIWRGTLRFTHVLTLPALMLAGALFIHAGLWFAGMDLAHARAQGWLLAPFSQTPPPWPWSAALLSAVQWDLVAQQADLMVSAIIVATISLLLSDTSLEVAWETRADLNRDLRALGQANLLASALGGLLGGVSISRSVLNRSAGAVGRGSGYAKAAFCLAAMWGGGPVIALVPRPVLGGLLICLGLDMCKAWIIDSRRRLSRSDYATVLGMVVITATLGFVPAVCVGVLACCLDFAISSARLSPIRRHIGRGVWPSKVERSAAQTDVIQAAGAGLRIIELQGVLFFGSTTLLTHQVETLLNTSPAPARLLFDFQRVRWVDSSAAQALGRLFRAAGKRSVEVDLSAMSPKVEQALRATGCLAGDGPTLCASIDEAVSRWDERVLAHTAVMDTSFEAWLALAMPSTVEAEQVMRCFESLTLAPGDLLFAQGDPSDALFLVRSGRLSASVMVEGREMTVRAIHAGGAMGEMGLFRSTPRSATIRAEQASVVLKLGRRELDQLEREQPSLAAAFYRVFLQQLAGRIDQLTAQAHTLSV